MLVQSHIYLAKKISKKLGKNFNRNFYLGSIAPDFLHHHKKRKHEFRYSFTYVLQEINSITMMTDLNLISYKLGIVSHYLADFFCKAHNCERLLNNIWEHFQYESLLHKVLISSKTETQLEIEINDVEKYLKQKYDNYLKQDPSVVIDILYSLEVCQSVSYYILQKIDNNVLRKIA